MGRVRRCDSRCHNAKGPRCLCWCGGKFHSTAGLVNREALRQGKINLEETGFEKGKTVYLEQVKLPLGDGRGNTREK